MAAAKGVVEVVVLSGVAGVSERRLGVASNEGILIVQEWSDVVLRTCRGGGTAG